MSKTNWIGETVGGRYVIEEMLGRGGMSTVYKARDPNLRRVVAVKMIHAHLSDDPRFVTRFEEEATAVAQLRHPNIVQVFDFNSDGDIYYMVMEYVPGETLQERLHRQHATGRRLPALDAVRYSMQVCDALNYAHQRGMVHRDIKPANIMLDVRDQAILMDFGIVKMIGSERHTATGAVVGTAMYMSPEMIRGETPDARADIYSMGVTLYEMVNGEAPFKADSAMTLMMMHLHDPIPDLRSLLPEVPEDLIQVIEKSLQKDRNARFASTAEMEGALRQVSARLSGGAAPVMTVIEPPPGEIGPSPVSDPSATMVDPQTGSPPAARPDSRQAPAAPLAAAAVAAAASPPAYTPVPAERAAPLPGTIADTPITPASQAYPTATPASPSMASAPPPSTWSGGGVSPTDSGSSGGGGMPPTPVAPAGSASPGRRSISSTALLVGGIVLALLVVAGVIGFFSGRFFGSGENQSATSTAEAAALLVTTVAPTEPSTDTPEPTATATETQVPPTPTTDLRGFYGTLTPEITPTEWVPPAPLFARITGVNVDGSNRYVVEYSTYGYTEQLPGMHVHFFFDTVTPENAGVPGAGPWILYGGPRPFTEYTVSDRPVKATQMCALVANHDHTIIPESGNCFPLP